MLADNILKPCIQPFCASEKVCVEIQESTPAENGHKDQALQTSQPPVSSDLRNPTSSFATSVSHPSTKPSASHDGTPALIVSASPDVVMTIIKRRGNQDLVDVSKGGATVGLNESCSSDDKNKNISSLQPPMTRGIRHQLDYHTPRIESRKALGHRGGAARTQRQRLERVLETEAAVVQSEAHNAALRSQLAAAVRFIEHLGYSASAALSDLPARSPAFDS